jgi:nucleoside-diphosphate-sugar epimerase
VHVAAAFRGVAPEEVWAVNHGATVELAKATLSAEVGRFVFTSTNLVYGPGRGRPLREDDELRPSEAFPSGAYPDSKAAAEAELFELHQAHGLGLRTLRLAFVYGDGDPHLAESTMFARNMAAHQRMAMVHHADVAQAVLRVLRAPGIDGRAYNVADDAPMTAYELLAFNGEDLPEGAGERVLGDPWQGIPDVSRIRAELGFRPVHPSVYAARDAGAL